jgi:NADH-quinone oxidoreductase subunit G
MATIHVDGKDLEVDGADNLLAACLSLGLDIPYFCWHPALGSVGACRQCAVKQYANADDKRGRLVMSCMTPATDNTYISIDDAEATSFRQSVVEWLMTNHPHDCPVCEEGGHCHLQDMTVMTGHHERRYRFTKRTHQNQDLGPFINHEMNRCIACYRCVRYYKDYAGGTDLGVFGAHDNVYFGRAESGVLESEFSGNLTEVCPTGVFTDRTHSERYNRKWDMQFSPSICQGCAVGCNTSPGERYGELRRIENRYNGTVNHYFLCDRGRFGYGFVNRKDRPRTPVSRLAHGVQNLGVDVALDNIAGHFAARKRIIGIGSPRASLEANHSLRELVGADNYFAGVSASELTSLKLVLHILRNGPVRSPALREIEEFDSLFVLGEDLTQTAPRVALALRQASKNKAVKMAAAKKVGSWQAEAIGNIGQHARSPFFIGSVAPTRLDDVATAALIATPDELARLGFAVANIIDSNAPAVADLSAELRALATQIAADLLAADKPLVVSGTSLGSDALVQAAANVAAALQARGKTGAGISLVVPEVNSLGLAMLGGEPLDAALAALSSGAADAVVVLENDLYRRAPAAAVDAALKAATTVVVIDHQQTPTSDKAQFLLPAASFAEGDGTMVNMEGRAQRYFQVFDPVYYDPNCLTHESWRWAHALHSTLRGKDVVWDVLDHVTAHVAETFPELAGIIDAAPLASFRIKGMKVARSPRRYSGRTATRAALTVHEPRASQDVDSALAFSMEGYSGPNEPSPLIPFAWAPGWNSPQSWNKFQAEVGGHLNGGDPGTRLLEPAATFFGYFTAIPAADQSRAGALRLLPLHHIFGSDELSARADVVSSQIPPAYIALNASTAAGLGVQEGGLVSIDLGNRKVALPLRIVALPAGSVGLPVGLEGIPAFVANSWASVSGGAA